ncbi:uncharacterized protein LOC142330635 [Lycorma delicatula]|uniref:uncharacterized protein LOC142330635 n=1 Tax=Lycorma delicatula TaxID=130591 RepID=UPI003F513654
MSALLKEVCMKKYLEKHMRNKDHKEMGYRAILSAYNLEINEHNEKVLAMMDEEEKTYLSTDCGGEKENVNMEVLNNHNPAGLPPHVLKLKKNLIVICLRAHRAGPMVNSSSQIS